jgi:hypothetical protein
MITPDPHIASLKLSAAFITGRRAVKRFAWGSLGWGLLTLLFGLIPNPILHYVYLTFGVVLIVLGLWMLCPDDVAPRPLLRNAFALVPLGALSIVVQLFQKPGGDGRFLGAGVFQPVTSFAFLTFGGYWSAYQCLDRATLLKLQEMIGDMWKRKTKAEPELAEFRSEDRKFRAKFFPDFAILMLRDGKETLIAEKADLEITHTRRNLAHKMKADLRLESRTFPIEITKPVWQNSRPGSARATSPRKLPHSAATSVSPVLRSFRRDRLLRRSATSRSSNFTARRQGPHTLVIPSLPEARAA